MNEITRIHLAKTPYNIETQAHAALRSYLDAIEKALHADTDAMREIESRMTELLADRGISGETVVTMADVEALQKQLGDPKDFAGEDNAEESDAAQAPKKKLMRDTSNAMLGGVCSGIAAYFGWDVVWVRIAAVVLLFITSGVMIPLYIILLVVMPEAKTTSDRLEMAGEPVNLETLKQNATATVKRAEPLLLKLFRAVLGLFLVMGAIGAAAAVAAVIIFVALRPGILNVFGSNLEASISIGLMALGGIMLATFCGILASMIFSKNSGRNLVIALVITTIVGITSFGTGIAVPLARQGVIQSKLAQSNSSQQLSADLNNISSVKVASSGLKVYYTVSNDTKHATLKYNDFLIANPAVTLDRAGDTLVVKGSFNKTDACQASGVWLSFCEDKPLAVHITGPALQSFTTETADVSYEALTQENISVEQTGNSFVKLSSRGQIGTLNLNATRGSFSANDATVGTVNLSTLRHQSNFANINQLNINTETDSCSEPIYVSADHAGTVLVNGQAWNPAVKYPCVGLQLVDRG